MKRLIFCILIIFTLFTLTACDVQTPQENVLDSIGKCDSKEFYTHGGFQDYTDFAKYSFSSANLENNSYFTVVSESDIETVCSYIDNFEQWVEMFKANDPNDELAANYSFDRNIIDTEDYFYINEKENYQKFSSYDVWLFDAQTDTLYYFHNNI